MSGATRSIIAAACVVASVALGHGADAAPPVADAPDWAARAADAAASLATALDDSARGRPVDARLRAAIASFDDLLAGAPLSDGDRARVLYNRGLAHLALGDPASAVFDLRRSDALRPGREATERELERARARLAEPASDPAAPEATGPAAVQRGPVALAWNGVRQIDPALRWWLGVGGFAAAWGLLGVSLAVAARPRHSGLRSGLQTIAGTVGVAGVLSMATVWLEQSQTARTLEAVVIADDCRPRQGPDAVAYAEASFQGRQTVPRGAEVVVLEERTLPENPGVAAWLRVKERNDPADGASVWIPADAVGWVRSPDERAGPLSVPPVPPALRPPPPGA